MEQAVRRGEGRDEREEARRLAADSGLSNLTDEHLEQFARAAKAARGRRASLRSETLSAASPAVLITLAVVLASYSLSTPGVKAGKLALPTLRLSVAGTEPAAPPPGPPPSTASVNSGNTKLLRPNGVPWNRASPNVKTPPSLDSSQ